MPLGYQRVACLVAKRSFLGRQMTGTNWPVSRAGLRGHLAAILRQAAEVSGGGSVIVIDCIQDGCRRTRSSRRPWPHLDRPRTITRRNGKTATGSTYRANDRRSRTHRRWRAGGCSMIHESVWAPHCRARQGPRARLSSPGEVHEQITNTTNVCTEAHTLAPSPEERL